MWALRLDAPRRLLAGDHPEPDPGSLAPGQVILRFRAGGICGSDLPRFKRGGDANGSEPVGRSLHEIVGEVVASRSDLAVGDRVVGWVEGSTGLAEYVVTVAEQLAVIDAPIDDHLAVALQPLACVLHALERSRVLPGARVAVVGLGPIGALFAHVASDLGAAHVTGVDVVDRSSSVAPFHVDDFVHRSSLDWAGASGHPDLVVECIGHQTSTLNDCVRAVRPGGEILYFGVPDDDVYPFDFGRFKDKRLTLSAGNTPESERRGALEAAAAYAARHPRLLGDYVTEVLDRRDAQRAYDLACQPRGDQYKVVITDTAG